MTAITMAPQAVASRIEEDYSSGAPYQWAIEWLRNVWVKPDATRAYIRVRNIPELGVRVVLADDGAAMTEVEMDEYLATLGKGTGDIWRYANQTGNRHAGLRAALLPWTDFTVVSFDGDTGYEMELYYDAASDGYEASPVMTCDPRWIALAADVLPGATHGVLFVLTGRDDADGPFVDPNKPETTTGLTDALRDRVLRATNQTTGAALDIAVDDPLVEGSDTSPGGGRRVILSTGAEIRLDARKIKGLEPWVVRATEQGEVVLDEHGTIARWWLLPAADSVRRLAFGGKGFVRLLYKNELMDPGVDTLQAMRTFGMTHAAVFDRVGIVIKPPTEGPDWHVKQNASRSRMEAYDGAAVPFADWGERFIDAMPDAIREANLAARGTSTGSSLERVRRVYERVSSKLLSVTATRRRQPGSGIYGVVNENGTVDTDSTEPTSVPRVRGEGDTAGRSGRGTATTSDGGCGSPATGADTGDTCTTPTPRRRTSRTREVAGHLIENFPEHIPVPVADDWLALGNVTGDFLMWDRGADCIYMNMNHPIMQRQVGWYMGPWMDEHPAVRRRVTEGDMTGLIAEVYHLDACTRIAAVAGEAGESVAHRLLTSEALTLAAYGYEAVDRWIEPIAGGLGSSRRAAV